jgi:hypothetical protein
MSDLSRLDPQLDGEAATCRVIIETPKGGRGKMTYDPESGAFALKRLLPDGMSFPLDFGFVPGTRAQDGDPIDVLVLNDEPAAVGTLMSVRLIGVIEAEQTEDGETVRNDRLLAVASVSHLFARDHCGRGPRAAVPQAPDRLLGKLQRPAWRQLQGAGVQEGRCGRATDRSRSDLRTAPPDVR